MTTDLIVKSVPKTVVLKTEKYMKEYCMSLNDAFCEAVRETGCVSANLKMAWNVDDFREYIPSAYLPEYLDFEKYPLRYKL